MLASAQFRHSPTTNPQLTAPAPRSTPESGRSQVGLRPGELRKLAWDHVDLDHAVIHVWRSASRTGDVKTPKSKRSLELPRRAVTALQAHRKRQAAERLAAGAIWQDNNLVFCHEDGRMYTSDALNWRFGKMTRRAGKIGRAHV